MNSERADDGRGGKRRLRKDAQRNQEQIVQAAREVFAAQGLKAGLNDIAKHAGVGVGTVYRRFPSKEALIELVLREELSVIEEVSHQAIEMESGWDGLFHLLEKVLTLDVVNLGLRDIAASQRGFKWAGISRSKREVIRGSSHLVRGAEASNGGLADNRQNSRGGRNGAERDQRSERVESSISAVLVPYLVELIERAQADGSLRSEAQFEDFMIMLCMLSELSVHSSGVQPDAWRRYLALFADGLRGDAQRRSLPSAMSFDEMAMVARRWIADS